MGPLAGYKIVEIAGIGPAPHCAMLLAEMGAEVLRIDRPSPAGLEAEALASRPEQKTANRSRRSLAVDLKNKAGVAALLRLLSRADALIEGMRPGVMERLGLGPEIVLARNPRLVYGRVTGWGQEGPLAGTAGHDLNYLALTGALASIGADGSKPTPPMNLIADMGGGALYLAVGVLAALLEAAKSGRGQVVDAAMVDGTVSLMNFVLGLRAMGSGAALSLGGTAPNYQVYATADGKYIALAALEDKFFDAALVGLGLDPREFAARRDPAAWAALSDRLAAVFATKSRDEWCEILTDIDACIAPVLTIEEAATHPHNLARANLVTRDGVLQAAPAPRFSRTQGAIQGPPTKPGENGRRGARRVGVRRGGDRRIASAGRGALIAY